MTRQVTTVTARHQLWTLVFARGQLFLLLFCGTGHHSTLDKHVVQPAVTLKLQVHFARLARAGMTAHVARVHTPIGPWKLAVRVTLFAVDAG